MLTAVPDVDVSVLEGMPRLKLRLGPTSKYLLRGEGNQGDAEKE